MKKIMALLLAVFMVFSLCACGNEQNDTSSDLPSNNNSSEKGEDDTVDLSAFTTMDEVMNYLATFIDTSKYGNDDIPGDESTDRRELLVKEPTTMANEITVSEKLIKFPLSCDVPKYCVTGYEEFTITGLNSAIDYFSVGLADKDGKSFNISGTSVDNLNNISFMTYGETNPQFKYMKEITNKATPKTVVETLGLPQQVYVHKYVSATGLISYFEIRFMFRNEGETRQIQVEFSGDTNINGMRSFSYSSLEE